ncbi:MAG: hypothetical protein DI551_07220 [Micavibrio aeruginosavorus]|uniref:Uncharacterized protein n=1 Tax=Micavibrio aeruginosavorus TaxID=349221 RepID=A0A2W5MW22_9BACT|nr:MAG: hypothetical protein DI551_07220 [Micavibrio aeruginosavorus]
MNDFLNGWSSGMTGSGGGLPSQSVLEKMGRDAAANHWNNNNAQTHSGSGAATNFEPGIPITTTLYQAGKKMTFKKLARDFGIAIALMIAAVLVNWISPLSWWDWETIAFSIPGYLLMFWVFLRLPFYGIARIGSLFEKEKTEEKKTEKAAS